VLCVADSIAYKFGERGGGLVSLKFRDSERRDSRRDVVALGFSTTLSDAVLLRLSSTGSSDFLSVELVSYTLPPERMTQRGLVV